MQLMWSVQRFLFLISRLKRIQNSVATLLDDKFTKEEFFDAVQKAKMGKSVYKDIIESQLGV